MLENLRGNWLFFRVLAIYTVYAIIGCLVERPIMFNLVAMAATVGGIILFGKYAKEAWRILWKKERGSYGAHHAVLGAAEVGLGLMYMGMFRLVWNYFDQPLTWQATWFSSLGLFMVAKGVIRQGTSTGEDAIVIGLPRRFWTWLVLAVCLIAAFFAGTTFGPIDGLTLIR